MTLVEKINKLTWFKEIIKLKEILLELFQSISSIQTDVEGLQNNPVDSRPYKIYTALLTQSGTNAPVATVLENTLGTISFAYFAVGYYGVASENLFSLNKTVCILSGSKTSSYEILVTDINSVSTYIEFKTSIGSNTTNGILDTTMIEIRVYN